MRNPNALPASCADALSGVADVSLATMLDVRPGAELNDVDMTLRLERLYRIRGRVIDASTGQPPAKVEIALTHHGLIAEGVRTDNRVSRTVFLNSGTWFLDRMSCPQSFERSCHRFRFRERTLRLQRFSAAVSLASISPAPMWTTSCCCSRVARPFPGA